MFVMVLARCGVVAAAARSVGMSVASAYQLRKRPGAASFAAAWDRAVEEGRLRALDVALARTSEDTVEPVFRRGRQVAVRSRTDNRLLYAALRAFDHLAEKAPNPRAAAASRTTPHLAPMVLDDLEAEIAAGSASRSG